LGQTDIHDEDDYLEMGFTGADIPELIRLVEDTELRNLPWGEEGEVPPEVYAQVHAWRTLGQLEAVEAIPSLIGLLHWIDDDGDDFVGEEVPVMLGKMGAVAIQPCRDTLADRTRKEFERIAAGTALVEIGKQHPEAREACVQALMSTLENYRDDDEEINAFTLSDLADLEAVEAAPLAKEIFEAECADETVMGDFEDFQVKVGLLEERITPDKGPSRAQLKQMLSAFKNVEPVRQHKVNKAKKEKARRKQEKKARRRNRKR
jgi:hypothetical protein